MLDYKRDLVTPEIAEEVEREIGQLDAAIRTADEKKIEDQVHLLDEKCGKLARPQKDAGIRENVEVFLVAIVVALGVRTYFLQPFTIPTGSMQPTLNGIIGHRTNEPSPNPLVQAAHMALFGRTYVDVVAKADETITDISEEKRFGFFTYTRIKTSSENEYLIHVQMKTVVDDLMDPAYAKRQGKRTYKAGEPIARGYVDTGDHVFVDKCSYNFCKPVRGEVFVFTTKGIAEIMSHSETSQFYIKRMAGTPLDTLRIDPPNLYINGSKAVSPPFLRVASGTLANPKDGYRGYSNGPVGWHWPYLNSPESTVTLESDQYFALGDNSYYSSDSRNWGTVPEENVMGHAVFVYWPFGPHWGLIR